MKTFLRHKSTRHRIGKCRQSSSTSDLIQGPALLKTTAHRPRPSLFSLPGLRSLPYWSQYDDAANTTRIAYSDPTVTQIVQHLESNWASVRDEYDTVKANVKSDYDTQTEHATLHEGQWDWRSYVSKGRQLPEFKQQFPTTTKIMEDIEDQLFVDLPFGYSFLSTLHAQSRIKPHTSPMNLRLRIHLGLHIPKSDCGISVGGIEQQWRESKCVVLDDSFTHHVWNNHPTTDRVVFLVDIWHPDISVPERTEIINMFKEAKAKGWFKAPEAK